MTQSPGKLNRRRKKIKELGQLIKRFRENLSIILEETADCNLRGKNKLIRFPLTLFLNLWKVFLKPSSFPWLKAHNTLFSWQQPMN